MSAIEDINTAMDAAVAAQEAGDYVTAAAKVETAYVRICGLPDSEFENERLEWSREALSDLLTYLRKRIRETAVDSSGSRGAIIRPVDIRYTRG